MYLLLFLIQAVSKVQVDALEVDFSVYLLVVVVFGIYFFVLETIHIISEIEDELAVEQGHRESIVFGFLPLGATVFSLVHNPSTSEYFNIYERLIK